MSGNRYEPLTEGQVQERVPVPWRVVDGVLVARYRTATMVRGLDFVVAIVAAAQAADHHPDIDFRYGTVGLSLTTHALGGLSDADVDLAVAIARIAAESGIEAG